MAATRHSPASTSDSRTPLLTPARVATLVVVAVLAMALGLLRLTSVTDQVSVPAGASAGELVLEPCEYAGENGSHPADCGTLVVAENPAAADSNLIALPVIRLRAISPDPRVPVLYLTGGPGQSNVDLSFADRYARDRDVVLVGYRGIDGSVRLDCPEVASATKRATDLLSEEFFRAYEDAYRSCADRLTDEGFDLSRYGLVQQVEDMETARAALGYDRFDLLSESAGTRTALIYAWRHPESVHRSVMIGVNPPGAFLWDAETTDEQIGRFAALCAADETCRARTDDLAATLRRAVPDRWLFLPIKPDNVRVFTPFGLFETAPTGGASAPMTIDTMLSAAEGDASGAWLVSLMADLMLPDLFVEGQYASAATLDAQSAREYFADGPGDLVNVGRAATAYGWAAGGLAEVWPATIGESEYRTVRSSDVETLVINGELDVASPPQLASEQLLPSLPNGQEVVLPGFGHTGSFFKEQPEAGTHLVNTYFATGRVDDSEYVPQSLDFTPPTTHGALARNLLGVLLALATTTLASLVLLAARVRVRGRVGRVSGAALRSVGAVLLGLGGWCLGALVVLATMPSVRVDNALLAVLAVGVPVGLVAYLAWVHRDWPLRLRRIGLALAAAGALVGAWLGYLAVERPVALGTAVIGAVAGANLALVLLGMWSSRSQRSTHTTTPSRDAAHHIEPPSTPTVAGRS
jgi:pimeloyl-ACP methyl ester carboxylesterase